MRIPLEGSSPVFQIGTQIYALVDTPRGSVAQEVYRENGVYYRSGVAADVSDKILNGVFHQEEHFCARMLPNFCS